MPVALLASATLLAALGGLALARAILKRPADGGSAPAVDPDGAAERTGAVRIVAPPPSSNDNPDRLYESVERELRARGHLR